MESQCSDKATHTTFVQQKGPADEDPSTVVCEGVEKFAKNPVLALRRIGQDAIAANTHNNTLAEWMFSWMLGIVKARKAKRCCSFFPNVPHDQVSDEESGRREWSVESVCAGPKMMVSRNFSASWIW